MEEKMNTADVQEIIGEDGEIIEKKGIVTLSKPYKFEGSSYEKIDLSGLEDASAEDMIYVSRRLSKAGFFDFMPEMSVEYAMELSARKTGMPLEFFKGIPAKDMLKVKGMVMRFLYGTE